MATPQRNDAKGEALNDSWVELHFQSQMASTAGAVLPPRESDSPPIPAMSRPVHLNAQMEKLLLEAQREYSRSSRSSSLNASMASSRASPKSPHSPNNEPNVDTSLPAFPNLPAFPGIPEARGTDWIWDWSSRPEAMPPSDWGSRFKHPMKRHKLSVRNTRVMASGPFSMENLPTLLFTHACTFIMGAAVMFIYLKKYCQLSAITAATPID